MPERHGGPSLEYRAVRVEPTGEIPPEVRERIAEALGITPERIERLRTIARLVGGDFGMEVELGMPGQGSRCNPEERRIVIDPLAFEEYVAAHEGGHRAISRGPETIGVKRERAAELYGKIGFAYGKNACEDPADDTWWSRKYEGLSDLSRDWFDRGFSTDVAMTFDEAVGTMGIPQIREAMVAMGSVPRFVHFGNEIQRLWHTGAIASSGLPDDVRLALERVRDAAREYFADVPADHPTEFETIARARSRFRTFHDRVWPDMERLVAEDLKDERIRKMAEEAQAKERGGEGSPLDALPEELRRELAEAVREAAERAAEMMERMGEEEAQRHERDAHALEEAIKQFRHVAGDEAKPDAERADAEQGIAGLEGAREGLQGKAEAARAHGRATAERLRSGEIPPPVPLDQLPDDLRRALEEAYARLPAAERKRIEAAARRTLEALEDALNAELEGKLLADREKPESHAERRDREEREATERERQRAEERERARTADEIRRAIEQQKTPYDRAYESVAPLIDLLADDLDRLFRKERNPRWRGSFPTGGRLALQKAMQVEADPSRYGELWERKTIPEKHDRTFTILVDLSGSMGGEKIVQTFAGAIVIAEALGRVGLSVEVLGFQDDLIVFKDADEPMSDAVRERMSGMVAEVSNQNPGGLNHAGYNDDGYCVDRTAARLRERPQKERFLLVLSDGAPVPSPAHAGPEWELGGIVAAIRRMGDVRTLGLGIGPGTEHVRGYYPNSVVEPDVALLPESLATVIEDMIVNPDHY